MPLRGLAPALQEPLLTDTASKKPAISRATTSDRMAKTFAAAADAVSGEQSLPGQQNLNLNAFWTASLPFINMAIAFLNWLTPYVASAWTHLYSLYVAAPSRTLKMIFGAALCGFGGTFTASIAAIEAFRSLGGAQVYEALEVVAADVRAIGAASAADDAVDADNDGMPDVARTKPHELAQRKLAVAMTSIKEPGKLTEAIARLWACYLAILATMRMQFAQTTAIALGVVETFEYPLARLLAPGMAKLLGAGLAHWSETLLLSAVRLLAIVLAWYLQMILSAFYSALRGGQLFAEGLCDLIIANRCELSRPSQPCSELQPPDRSPARLSKRPVIPDTLRYGGEAAAPRQVVGARSPTPTRFPQFTRCTQANPQPDLSTQHLTWAPRLQPSAPLHPRPGGAATSRRCPLWRRPLTLRPLTSMRQSATRSLPSASHTSCSPALRYPSRSTSRSFLSRSSSGCCVGR